MMPSSPLRPATTPRSNGISCFDHSSSYQTVVSLPSFDRIDGDAKARFVCTVSRKLSASS
jgi:hypothetical protein